MTSKKDNIRLGADIGGTFTDIALDVRGAIFSTKVLTNYTTPEQMQRQFPGQGPVQGIRHGGHR
jgi:N-methylhydantoinase A/oxoprolinase/acetone carboxylase beta subunit